MTYMVTNMRGDVVTRIERARTLEQAVHFIWDHLTDRGFFARSKFEDGGARVSVSKDDRSDVLTIKEVK